MLITIVQVAAIFIVPALILRGRDNKLTRLFGTIGVTYFFGLLTALVVYLLNCCGLSFSLNSDVGEIGSYAAIGVAIPLLLFSTDVKAIRRLTRTVLASFGVLIFSVVLVTIIASHLLGRDFQWGRELCAMASGLYTGGTPNFNAIGVILGVDSEVIALGNLSDMLIGGVFYLFILLAAKPLLSLVMKGKGGTYMKNSGDAANLDELGQVRLSRPLLVNCGLALLCVAVGAGVGALIWLLRGSGKLTDMLVPAMMVTVTVAGLALSFVPKIRQVPGNTLMGHYLILVFSFALASSLDLTGLGREFARIFLLLALITVLTFVVHVLLSTLLGIDADCTIITMTAGIYGPAFIPAVSSQLKNQQLTAPGLICGSLGYAIGTLLGALLYLVM